MLTSNKAKMKLTAALRELSKAQERAYEALFNEDSDMETAAFLYEAEKSAEAAFVMIKEIRERIVG